MVLLIQAEDGIRDGTVTGVQTCALPICIDGVKPEPGDDAGAVGVPGRGHDELVARRDGDAAPAAGERGAQGEPHGETGGEASRSEERRVGKECGWRWSGWRGRKAWSVRE